MLSQGHLAKQDRGSLLGPWVSDAYLPLDRSQYKTAVTSSSRALVSRRMSSWSPTHVGSWCDEFPERTDVSPVSTSRSRISSVLECVSNEYVEHWRQVRHSEDRKV